MDAYTEFIASTSDAFLEVADAYGSTIWKVLYDYDFDSRFLRGTPAEAILRWVYKSEYAIELSNGGAHPRRSFCWMLTTNRFNMEPRSMDAFVSAEPSLFDASYLMPYISCLHWTPLQVQRYRDFDWDCKHLGRTLNTHPLGIHLEDREYRQKFDETLDMMRFAFNIWHLNEERTLDFESGEFYAPNLTPDDAFKDEPFIPDNVDKAMAKITGVSFITDGTLYSRWLTWPVLAALIDKHRDVFDSGEHADFSVGAFERIYMMNPMNRHRDRLISSLAPAGV